MNEHREDIEEEIRVYRENTGRTSGEDIIDIPRRMRYNCNDERRCNNEQSERN